MDLQNAILSLKSSDYFVWDQFLGESALEQIATDAQSLYARGLFKQAQVGKAPALDSNVRKDETYWLDFDRLSPSQSIFFNRIESVKEAINKELFLGLWSLEGHYSHYPPGAFYQKHLDRFASDDSRTVSMVLYLNSRWKPGDGGELLLHSNSMGQINQNIEPIGGRLVCFLSGSVTHEVSITQKSRLSFAGWWRRR